MLTLKPNCQTKLSTSYFILDCKIALQPISYVVEMSVEELCLLSVLTLQDFPNFPLIKNISVCGLRCWVTVPGVLGRDGGLFALPSKVLPAQLLATWPRFPL